MKVLIRAAFWIVGSAALVAGIYLGRLFVDYHGNRDFLSIDSCLDAGGKWDYDARTCEQK